MRRLFCCSLLVFFIIISNSCSLQHAPSSTPQKLTVYTSIYPIYDFTKRIAGPHATVINMTPPGVEPHSFQPSPRLITQLCRADLFLYNGNGMEPYVDKIRHSLRGASLIIIDTSSGITLINSEDYSLNSIDPHIWLSPVNAGKQGLNILQALIEADPFYREEYQANYDAFKRDLEKLDEEYKNVLTKCKKNIFAVSHAAFGYLARDYGLQQVAVMGLNAEAEPTPGRIRETIALLRQEGIGHILFGSLDSSKIAETVAGEINVKKLMLHPLGNLTEKEFQDGEDYFRLMRKNLESLKTALEYVP